MLKNYLNHELLLYDHYLFVCHLWREIDPPGIHLQSVTPAGATVQPRAVFVRHRPLAHAHGAAQRQIYRLQVI